MLLHASLTVRVFQTAVAKAGHAQTRRRDEATEQPNLNMKCAAVVLSYNQIENLKLPQVGPSCQQSSCVLALQLAWANPCLEPINGDACGVLQLTFIFCNLCMLHQSLSSPTATGACKIMKHGVYLQVAG